VEDVEAGAQQALYGEYRWGRADAHSVSGSLYASRELVQKRDTFEGRLSCSFAAGGAGLGLILALKQFALFSSAQRNEVLRRLLERTIGRMPTRFSAAAETTSSGKNVKICWAMSSGSNPRNHARSSRNRRAVRAMILVRGFGREGPFEQQVLYRLLNRARKSVCVFAKFRDGQKTELELIQWCG